MKTRCCKYAWLFVHNMQCFKRYLNAWIPGGWKISFLSSFGSHNINCLKRPSLNCLIHFYKRFHIKMASSGARGGTISEANHWGDRPTVAQCRTQVCVVGPRTSPCKEQDGAENSAASMSPPQRQDLVLGRWLWAPICDHGLYKLIINLENLFAVCQF